MAEDMHQELVRVLTDLRQTVGDLEKVRMFAASSLLSATESLNSADAFLKRSIPELVQGKPYNNHIKAFDEAKRCIEKHARAGNGAGNLSIQILAVSSSFSWHFVTRFIPDLLAKYDSVICKTELLLVNPDHLRKVDAGTNSELDLWADISESREDKARKMVGALPDRVRDRYTFSLRYYDNLPHWHGVLINGVDLLLGRTSWEQIDGHMHLRVGENTYRKFHVDGEQGFDRIFLFKNWFEYYARNGNIAYPK